MGRLLAAVPLPLSVPSLIGWRGGQRSRPHPKRSARGLSKRSARKVIAGVRVNEVDVLVAAGARSCAAPTFEHVADTKLLADLGRDPSLPLKVKAVLRAITKGPVRCERSVVVHLGDVIGEIIRAGRSRGWRRSTTPGRDAWLQLASLRSKRLAPVTALRRPRAGSFRRSNHVPAPITMSAKIFQRGAAPPRSEFLAQRAPPPSRVSPGQGCRPAAGNPGSDRRCF